MEKLKRQDSSNLYFKKNRNSTNSIHYVSKEERQLKKQVSFVQTFLEDQDQNINQYEQKRTLSDFKNQQENPATLKSENDELMIQENLENANNMQGTDRREPLLQNKKQERNSINLQRNSIHLQRNSINLQNNDQNNNNLKQNKQFEQQRQQQNNDDSNNNNNQEEEEDIGIMQKSSAVQQLYFNSRQVNEQSSFYQTKQMMTSRHQVRAQTQKLIMVDKSKKSHKRDKSKKCTFFQDVIQQIDSKDFSTESPIEDGKLSKFYNVRLLYLEYSLLFFTITNIAFSIIYYDSDFKTLDPTVAYNNTRVTFTCLWVTFLSAICLIVVTYFRYNATLDLEKCQKIFHDSDNLRSSGKLSSLFCEIILIILQPYPFTNDFTFITYDYVDQLEFEFKINHLFCLTCLIKSFIIIRVLLKRSIFINTRAFRLTKMYGCESNYQYAIKCLFNDYPLPMIGVVFSISIIICAFGLRICERPLTNLINLSGKGNNSQDFEYFENSIWCVVITMTTVGYGDYYPRTLIGRIWNIFIAIWGIFIVSMMILTLSNLLNLEQGEKKSLTVLNRLETRSELRRKAALFIAMYYSYKYVERTFFKEGKIPPKKHFQEKTVVLKRYTDNFKECNRTMKNLFDKDNTYEEMSRQFESIRDDIKNLNDNQDSLTKLLEESYNMKLSKLVDD